jgi:hypothetical protein
MADRKKVPHNVMVAVLTEAGYRCAVPTCRTILAIDLHHMVEVAEGGGNDPTNLLALCPTCHALFHRGEIQRESIYTWKSVLVSLSQAFDVAAVDHLLFLNRPEAAKLQVSGDGVLHFARLISAGLATFQLTLQNGPLLLYQVALTPRGVALIAAWSKGDRQALAEAMSTPAQIPSVLVLTTPT